MYLKFKRSMDVIFSILGIAILSPLFLVLSVAIKIESKGPVIFKQVRVGKDEKYFTIYKFRSMYTKAPIISSGMLPDPDMYITKVGKFMRNTSLDEIPQLFNILKGDMCIIGPRPVIDDESERELLEGRRMEGITTLIPGLTGWAQVNGRDEMSVKTKLKYEKEYLEKISFGFDVKIICKTIISVIKKEGISEGHMVRTSELYASKKE